MQRLPSIHATELIKEGFSRAVINNRYDLTCWAGRTARNAHSAYFFAYFMDDRHHEGPSVQESTP